MSLEEFEPLKMADVRALSDEELVHQELELDRMMIQARFQKQIESLENTSVFQKLRTSIARLRTEQSVREKRQSLNSDALRNQFRKSFSPTVSSSESSGGGFLDKFAEKLSTDS
jgi:ribosomal protein L29